MNDDGVTCDFCERPGSESHGGEMFFCEAHHARFVHLVRVDGLNPEDAWTLMDGGAVVSESDFVARVRAVAKEQTTLGQAFDCLKVADELERRDAEIKRLRDYVAALQEDRQMAGNQAAAMDAVWRADVESLLEAGTALWAFIVVNANEAITSHPQFSKVEKGWQQASWEAHRG